MITQEFPLHNGDRLKIGTTPVKLGDGSALVGQGLAPDISVTVSLDDERAYYADAFRVIPRGNLLASQVLSLTKSPERDQSRGPRPRFNEAELVRERKDGVNPESDLTLSKEAELEGPLVHDPVLARALTCSRGGGRSALALIFAVTISTPRLRFTALAQ